MNRFDRRVLGVATGLGIAGAAHCTAGQALAAAGASWLTSGGVCSPDMDQQWQADRKPRYRRTWLEVLLRKHPAGRVTPWRWRQARRGWLLFARVVSLAPWWIGGRGSHGDPSAHRGITHWAGIPAVWAVLVLAASVA